MASPLLPGNVAAAPGYLPVENWGGFRSAAGALLRKIPLPQLTSRSSTFRPFGPPPDAA